MTRDPLVVLRAAIDESLPPAAAERTWSRAQRRSRELDRRGGWALRLAGAIAVVSAVAVTAPSAVTSSPTSVAVVEGRFPMSNPASDSHKVPAHTVQLSLVEGNFWCNDMQTPDDTPMSTGGSYSLNLALCFVPPASMLPAKNNDPFFPTSAALSPFPEIWWSRYALLSHGWQLCYNLEQGRAAVLPQTFPNGDRLMCSNLIIVQAE